MQEVFRKIIEQNENIEIFKKDTVSSVSKMLLDEAQELVEAVEMAHVNDDLTEVVSEVADVFYLIVRIFSMLDLDENAIEMKIERNRDKYKGQPDTKTAKEEWAKKGGDAKWFEEYASRPD
jgi:phosphoribosyl-ATP pyrophosphohydrolase